MKILGYKINIGWSVFIVYVLLLALIAMCSSCGVRKVGTSKESSKNVNESKEESKAKVTKESSSSEEVETKEKNDIVKEKQETKVTEKFNPDGSLNERTTETKNKKSTDRSTKDRKYLKTSKTNVDSTITNKIYRNIIITEKKKVKDVESDKTVAANFGGWVPLILVLVIISVIFFVVYKRR